MNPLADGIAIPLFVFTTLRYAPVLALALDRGDTVTAKVLPGT